MRELEIAMDESSLPQLTDEDIRVRCTERSFERGEDYYRRGAIRNPLRQGRTLRALCEGSRYEPYRISIELDEGGVAWADCSCPYDWGGYCKHVVALLLSWLHTPQEFTVIPETEELLDGMTREELVDVIKAMSQREPDLLYLLERREALPPARETPIDPEIYRRQIAYAFGRNVDWDERFALASELHDIKRPADRFREGGDWANAWTIYEAIAEEMTHHYREFHDEGEVASIIAECTEGMVTCLRQGSPSSQPVRHTWIHQLFQIHLTDIDWGGHGLADSVPGILSELAQGEDGPFIEGLFREAISERRGDDWSSRWHRERLLRDLLQVYESQERNEDYLDLCWEERLDLLYALKLLELGRSEEALRAGRDGALQQQEVLQFSQALWEVGDGDSALSFAQQGLQRSYNDGLAGWLADRHEEQGEVSIPLNLQLQRFEWRPSLKRYLKVISLAEALGHEKDMRHRLLTFLEQKQNYSTLVEIYLEEEEMDKAIRAVRRIGRYHAEPYALRVAQAAEGARPQQALALYQDLALHHIARTNRGAYQVAAQYLGRVKQIYQRLGEDDRWRSHIHHLRAEYPRHRALQDELNKAGL